jgi:hypothetical protein
MKNVLMPECVNALLALSLSGLSVMNEAITHFCNQALP